MHYILVFNVKNSNIIQKTVNMQNLKHFMKMKYTIPISIEAIQFYSFKKELIGIEENKMYEYV